MILLNSMIIQQIQERDISIDILKGIGILFVLVAHSLSGYIHTFAYSFHIPLFFIVTGYFCKPKPIYETMKHDFKRLFVPFFFTTVFMLLLSLVLYPFELEGVKDPRYTFEALIFGNASSVNYHKIWGNWAVVGSVWFLPALFWSKTIFNCLIQKQGIPITIIVLILGGIAAWVGQYMLLPYSFLQAVSALPFLLIGYIVSQKGGIKKITEIIWNSNFLKSIIFLLFFCWFLTTFIDCLSLASFKWKLFYYPNILFAGAGTYFIYLTSTAIAQKTTYFAKVLSFLGKYSIILVCFPVIESYMIPLETIIPVIPFKSIIILGCKVLWCVLAIILSFEIPFLRNIFSIKDKNLLRDLSIK